MGERKSCEQVSGTATAVTALKWKDDFSSKRCLIKERPVPCPSPDGDSFPSMPPSSISRTLR
jgi:hypothetical protein